MVVKHFFLHFPEFFSKGALKKIGEFCEKRY